MTDKLTIAEINERYPDEWVLIGEPETDESLEVHGGTVLYHGKSREEMYQAAKDLPAPKYFATHHTDTLTPDEKIYCLNLGLPEGLGLSAEQWR